MANKDSMKESIKYSIKDSTKLVEKKTNVAISNHAGSKSGQDKVQSLQSLAEELCLANPNRVKLRSLCKTAQIDFAADPVELMSTVLFELSCLNIRKGKNPHATGNL